MALIMACGTAWRFIKPQRLSAEQTRHVLTTVIYYLFLPAMVFEVLWKADIGVHSLEYTGLGVAAVCSGLAISWFFCTLFKFTPAQKGAVILATAFPNVTYLGLPVLAQTFGPWARSVAIQLDFFAAGPLLFTIGIAIARYFGEDGKKSVFFLNYLNTPPFWAAFMAVLLNINNIPAPDWLYGVFQKMSAAVVPVMLFSLGLALSWESVRFRNLPYVLPVIAGRLILVPLGLTLLLPFLTIDKLHQHAALLDLAMPSMVLGIVFCDRYKLDSGLYAMSVTMTTLLSLISLPFWYDYL